MKKIILSLLFLLLPAVLPFIQADTVPGTVSSEGHVFKEGLWWKDSVGYSRQLYNQPGYSKGGYYANGYYYPGQYVQGYDFYRYTAVSYQPPGTKETVKYTANWKTEVLKLAEKRDDLTAYLAALKALGISPPPEYQQQYNNVAAPNGSYLSSLTQTNSYQTGHYGAQGNTVYGYSYASLKDLYGDTNPAVLFQQSARLTQNAQQLAGQAKTDFDALLSQERSNRARIATILALSQASQPPPSQATVTREFRFQLRQGQNGQTEIVQADPQTGAAMPRAENGDVFSALVQSKCAACHTGSDARGGFQVSSWNTLAAEKKLKIVQERLLNKDGEKRMPKKADGSAGTPLTPEEIAQFLTH